MLAHLAWCETMASKPPSIFWAVVRTTATHIANYWIWDCLDFVGMASVRLLSEFTYIKDYPILLVFLLMVYIRQPPIYLLNITRLSLAVAIPVQPSLTLRDSPKNCLIPLVAGHAPLKSHHLLSRMARSGAATGTHSWTKMTVATAMPL